MNLAHGEVWFPDNSSPFHFSEYCDECLFEAWERMTLGGVEVDLSIYVNDILKEIWCGAISDEINGRTGSGTDLRRPLLATR